MRKKTITIDGTEFSLISLTRGQVRELTAEKDEQKQADDIVKLSTGQNPDDIDMLAFKKLLSEIMTFNGLTEESVDDVKKN